MPLSAAERQQRRRQKLKEEGKYEEYKKKNNAEAKKSRNKKENHISKLTKSKQAQVKKEMRENIRNRVAKCRALKKVKVSPVEESTPAYKTASALGKATARAKRSLPMTPRRKKAVIKKLFESEIGNCDADVETPAPEAMPRRSIPSTTVELAKDFYERDDVSRQAPGRKDVVSVRQTDGTKVKLQTRHLLVSIKEAHALFMADNPDVKIGKSKFATVRPQHVLLSCKLPHNVCLCKYHENFISAINDLHKYLPFMPNYSNDFPEKLLCGEVVNDCWMNKCSDCKDGKGFMKLLSEFPETEYDETANWHVWRSVDNERLCKVVEEGTVEDLVKHILGLIPQFLEHCFVKRHQAKEYHQQRKEATSESFKKEVCLIQVDFSENYKCVSQDEIQSAHWSQAQVSLFTVAMWHSGTIHSKVIATDDLTHSKDTVLPFISKILEGLPKEIKLVRVWSDGPTSQFKNKFIAAALPVLQDRFNVVIEWNFFATSHGKGPVDGIGGSVKRQVWDGVKKRTFTVYNAKDFVSAAVSTSNVEVSEMSAIEIKSRYNDLHFEKVFKTAPAIEGIMHYHFLRVVNGNTVGKTLTEVVQDEDIVVAVGEWCLVKYDEQLYPGEVKDKTGEEYLVSVMVEAGSYWKWPSKRDEIYYPAECVIKKLDPPTVVNARGHFRFDKL